MSSKLRMAAQYGHVEKVIKLLTKDIDINARDCNNRTALNFAVANGHIHTTKLLIEKGADIHTVYDDHSPLLHITTLSKDLLMAELLLNAGVNINDICGDRRSTALHGAAMNGNVDVVKFLLKNNANKYLKNNRGETALDHAKHNKNSYYRRKRKQYEEIINLLKEGSE